MQYDLQEMMQDLVGIVRKEDELVKAMEELKKLWQRADKVKVIGNREYNNGWHTALGPAKYVDCFRSDYQVGHRKKRKPGRAF